MNVNKYLITFLSGGLLLAGCSKSQMSDARDTKIASLENRLAELERSAAESRTNVDYLAGIAKAQQTTISNLNIEVHALMVGCEAENVMIRNLNERLAAASK